MPFKSYLGQYIVYKFIISMTEEWRHCDEVMKEHSNKKLAMTKKDDQDVESSTGFVVILLLMVMLKPDSRPPK